MDNQIRVAELRGHMELAGIHTAFIVHPDLQFYLTGFRALLYSRPIILVIDQYQTAIIIPGLEAVHAREVAKIDKLYVYYEHPNAPNDRLTHMDHIKVLLSKIEKNQVIALDMDFAPSGLYRYFQTRGFTVEDIGDTIIRMRYLKSMDELAMVKSASALVEIAVKASLNAIMVGATELEIDAVGTRALFEKVSEDHSVATLDFFAMSPSGPLRSTMPHVFSSTRQVLAGDVIIHSRQVSLNGYRSELERTVIVGGASQIKRNALTAATEAQLAALDHVRSGVQMSTVDQAAREVFQNMGFIDYVIHRTGHGIGVAAHEPPYIRYDNDMLLQEGMVFTIEPGIYIPNVGGFRHSDTIVVTKNGYEMLTHYSTELDHLILAR